MKVVVTSYLACRNKLSTAGTLWNVVLSATPAGPTPPSPNKIVLVCPSTHWVAIPRDRMLSLLSCYCRIAVMMRPYGIPCTDHPTSPLSMCWTPPLSDLLHLYSLDYYFLFFLFSESFSVAVSVLYSNILHSPSKSPACLHPQDFRQWNIDS